MSHYRLIATAALLFAGLLGPSIPSHASYVDDQLLVRFKTGSTQTCRDSAMTQIGGSIVDSLKIIGYHVVELADTSVIASVAALQARPHCIAAAQVNGIAPTDADNILTAPNDSLYSVLNYLHNTGQDGGTPGADIGAEAGWNYIHDAPNVVIAVFDTGVDYYHSDLQNNLWVNSGETGLDGLSQDRRTNNVDDDNNGYVDDHRGWSFYYDTNDPYDNYGFGGHGTGTAGHAAARGNNTIGMTGVAWSAKIMPVKVLGNSGQSPTESRLVDAVEYAVDNGANILNFSLRWPSGYYGTAFENAIIAAGNADVMVICGAGNTSTNNDSAMPVPSTYNAPGLMSVTAVSRDDEFADPCPGGLYASYGATTVDVAAAGCNMMTMFRGSTYDDDHSGTSASAPVVSGAAALLWAQNPTWTGVQVKNRLMATVDTLASCSGKMVAPGRIDIGRALDNVKPSALSDLSVAAIGRTTQTITWTDTGDDTTYGQSTKYHFKYQTGSAITNETQFASASTSPHYLGAPGPSGTFHCVVVSSLTPCTTYGWALKLEDPEFNISGLSNSASGTTDCDFSVAICDDLLMAGGGDGGEGGGEESIRSNDPLGENQAIVGSVSLAGASGSSLPIRLTSEEGDSFSWRAENSLRIGCSAGELTDVVELRSVRPSDSGDYRVRLAASGEQPVTITDASLAVVDHVEGTAVVSTAEGIHAGTLGAISACSVQGGVNRTAAYQSGLGAESTTGEILNVTASGEGSTLLMLEMAARATTAELAGEGVDVQVQDGEGWSTLATLHPRRSLARTAVNITGKSAIRLIVNRPVFIASIATLSGAETAAPEWLDLHSVQTTGEGGSFIVLDPAEHATFTYRGSVVSEGDERALFLRVTSDSDSQTRNPGSEISNTAPPVVALALTMRPNPASGQVTVEYSMPRETSVSIAMYDVAGRLVRQLSEGSQPAGTHTVTWDARDQAGTPVRGGVYFCKMEVGSWTNVKKMVFVPGR